MGAIEKIATQVSVNRQIISKVVKIHLDKISYAS